MKHKRALNQIAKLASGVAAAVTRERAMEIVEAVPQRVSVGYDAYNSRRYSKPWIARIIAWPVGGVPTMESGSYVGDKKGGEVEIMAGPGDIIRDGQRDGRGGN